MEIVACPDCDLLPADSVPAAGREGSLPTLRRDRRHRTTGSIDRVLALTITAAIVFVIANTRR